jgi:hypothetical protein
LPFNFELEEWITCPQYLISSLCRCLFILYSVTVSRNAVSYRPSHLLMFTELKMEIGLVIIVQDVTFSHLWSWRILFPRI